MCRGNIAARVINCHKGCLRLKRFISICLILCLLFSFAHAAVDVSSLSADEINDLINERRGEIIVENTKFTLNYLSSLRNAAFDNNLSDDEYISLSTSLYDWATPYMSQLVGSGGKVYNTCAGILSPESLAPIISVTLVDEYVMLSSASSQISEIYSRLSSCHDNPEMLQVNIAEISSLFSDFYKSKQQYELDNDDDISYYKSCLIYLDDE